MAGRQRVNEALEMDTLARDQKINTREIRMQHYLDMDNLERNVYDKGSINDNEIDYDFLHKREHYNPLNYRFRPFFTMPLYARRQDWEHKPSWATYFGRLTLGIFLCGVGYKAGTWDSTDELIANQTVIDFESEEQIYDLLYN